MKMQKHIEIVRSTTLSLSSMSQKSCSAIQAVLNGYFKTVGVTVVNNSDDLQKLILKKPDLVFLGIKYVPSVVSSKKVWISEFLDDHGILHTGSGQAAIEYELNKPLAKQRVLSAGIPTSKSVVIKQGQTFSDEEITLEFPLFVKPVNLGGGAGIDVASQVQNLEELRARVLYITQVFATDALVEEYLPGREFSVALLRNLNSNILEAMPIELSAPVDDKGEPVLSQAIKTSNQEIILPVIDPELRAYIIAFATDAFNALGARDYGRIDIRLDRAGVAHFLEANLIPSLISGYGSFPKACVLNRGMDYETMILAIVNLAFDREVAIDADVLEPSPEILTSLALPV